MKLWLWLFGFYRLHWVYILGGLMLAIIVLLANIALITLSGWFIASMALAGVSGAAINYFTPGAIIRGLSIMRTGGRYGERLVTHDAILRVSERLRYWLYTQLQQAPQNEVSGLHSGEALGRFKQDVDRVEQIYLSGIVPVIVAIAGIVVTVIVLLESAPLLALIEFVLLASAGVALPVLLHICGRKLQHVAMARSAKLSIQLTEYLQGQEALLLAGQAHLWQQEISQSSRLISRCRADLAFQDSMAQMAYIGLTGLAAVAALLVGLHYYLAGEMIAAMFAALPLLCLVAFDAVMPLGIALQAFPAHYLSLKRIYALQSPVSSLAQNKLPDPLQFRLELNQVGFEYQPDQALLQDISITLSAGDALLLTGPSGCGKSSLISLMTGFEKPVTGKILLNGFNQLDEETWRSFFSVAEQRPYIFTGTIRDNLMRAKPEASQAEMEAACELACLLTDVQGMKDGLNTFVGEQGAALSGGQRRRLTIARALLKGASCLILDEPTEGLDRLMADKLMYNLRTYCHDKNKALIIVSHDLRLRRSWQGQVLAIQQAQ